MAETRFETRLRVGKYTDPLMMSMTCIISETEPWWHRLLFWHRGLIWDAQISHVTREHSVLLCGCNNADHDHRGPDGPETVYYDRTRLLYWCGCNRAWWVSDA